MAGFLEEIALYTDIEQYDADADAVVMMTMHSAKGLEFPHVFLVGAEEGLFPSSRAEGEPEEMEEERRLCYVAITRAKKTLAISYADQRMLYGHTTVNRPSRFIEEIPPRLLSAPVRQRQPLYAGCPASSGHPQSQPRHTLESPPERTPRELPEFGKGDMVQHKSFGRGMVLSVMKMGNDALLEVAFDNIGTKRLMARTACVHMKKL